MEDGPLAFTILQEKNKIYFHSKRFLGKRKSQTHLFLAKKFGQKLLEVLS